MEHPLDPSTLTAVRTAISALALAVAVASSKDSSTPGSSKPPGGATAPQPHIPGDDDMLTTGELIIASSGSSRGAPTPGSIAATATELPLLARTFNGVVPAGIELGMYNFLGTSLQVSQRGRSDGSRY